MWSFLKAQAVRPTPTHPPRRTVYAPDRIGMVGFHDQGFIIAKPAVPHTARLQERSQRLHERVAGSGTNLTDGLRLAVAMLQQSPPGILRRIWLLTDGYPNRETSGIMPAVKAARQAYINLNTIAFGDQCDEALLRRMSAATHNGKFVSVHTLRELTNALVVSANGHNGPQRHHHRAETTILAIDLSGSMLGPMDGKSKVAVIEEAVLHLLHYKQQCFS